MRGACGAGKQLLVEERSAWTGNFLLLSLASHAIELGGLQAVA